MVSFSKNKKLNHPVKKIYNIIADVKKYPDFLPWCNEITIKEKTKKYIITEVKVGFQNINEIYLCVVMGTSVAISTAFMLMFLSKPKSKSFFSRWFHTVGFSAVIYDMILVALVYLVYKIINEKM